MAPVPPNVTPLFPNTKLVVNNAAVLATKSIRASKYLSGREALEIAVRTQEGVFPAEAQLPTLVMAGNKYSVSRYAPTGKLNSLIFSIPATEMAKLPAKGPMWVQYGRVNARKVWRMKNFVKSELQR